MQVEQRQFTRKIDVAGEIARISADVHLVVELVVEKLDVGSLLEHVEARRFPTNETRAGRQILLIKVDLGQGARWRTERFDKGAEIGHRDRR